MDIWGDYAWDLTLPASILVGLPRIIHCLIIFAYR